MARTWKHDEQRREGKVSQAEIARRLGISRQALHARKQYVKAEAAGLCRWCKKQPAQEDGVLCEDCSETQRERYRERTEASSEAMS